MFFLFFLFYEKSLTKKIFLTFLLIVLYIGIFGLTSHKFFLFIIFMLVILYVLAEKYKDISFTSIVLFIAFLTGMYFWDTDSGFITKSLLVRRLIMIPAQINYDYYHFFSHNPFVFFTDSKFLPFKYLLTFSYDLDVPHLIGREIYGHPDMSANTSWIGNGYAHAGFIGMVIYAVIIGIIFKYLDYLAKYLNYKFIIISFFPYVITMYLSSDLKTVLFTHGLLFYLIILTILSFSRYKGNTVENCKSRL